MPANAHAIPPRNASVDALRAAGAVAVVAFHATLTDGQAANTALGCFAFFVGYFTVAGGMAGPDRFARMMGLWLAWSAVYLSVRLADGDPLQPWMWLAGPSHHLWFLPFAAVLSLLVGALCRSPAPALGLWSMLAGTLALGSALPGLAETNGLPFPLQLWVAFLPAGVAGALLAHRGQWEPVALVALFAATPCGLGTFLAALALAWPLPGVAAVHWLGRLSLGIYLCHPLALGAVRRGLDLDTGTVEGLVAALGVSALLTLGLMRLARLRPGALVRRRRIPVT
ncbi:MAG: hypothetical protein ACFBSD_10700 [Paracoccaceae bacterium]